MSSGISSKPEQAGHGSPFLSFSTVFKDHFLPKELPDLMDISEDDMVKYSILEGDIFLTRTSETLDELGMSSVAVKDYSIASYSGFLKRLRPTQNDITYHKFMAFYLRSDLFRKTMNNNAIMTLRASLNEQIFSYLDLILPPFQEQKKIGDFLFAINKKIELNNKINTELEGMAKLMYDYWFVQFEFPSEAPDFVTQSGVEVDKIEKQKGYKSSGGKMVFNQDLKREIPEGWEVTKLIELVELVSENISSNDMNPKTPYVGLEHIPRKTIVLSKWEFANKVDSDKNQFKKHDILFGKIRPYFHKVGIAFIDGITSTDTIVMRPRQSHFAGISLQTVFTDKFVATATLSSTGTKMPRANWKVLKDYLIPIPNKNNNDQLLKDYQSTLDNALAKIENNISENNKLEKLRDWLLPMLMNGQVKVSSSASTPLSMTKKGYKEEANVAD